MQVFHHMEPFELECGAVLPALQVTYHTYGVLNEQATNAVWICHALTANSDVAAWWRGLVGGGQVINPANHFIVCANILGSPYGSTSPLSTDPETGAPYGSRFPPITIRDMARAHGLLAQHLHINSIELLVGGSMGGYQALEWCVIAPHLVQRLFLVATSAAESPWGIAVHAAQRLAIEGDQTWKEGGEGCGKEGLKAARAIGMLMYRSYQTYAVTQHDEDVDKLDNFKAASYINYQGHKFSERFDAQSYWILTKALDSHHLARGRGQSLEQVLSSIWQQTLIIGITSDGLCPVSEQEFLAAHIPNAQLIKIDSLYGHDGFLVETETIGRHLNNWIQNAEGGAPPQHSIKREIQV